MKNTSHAIANFWLVFQEHSKQLAAITTADDPVYDLILEQLQQIHPQLYFEFSSQPQLSELVITAEGNRSLFPLVDSIVASAPEIPGWVIFALKPKLGFPVTATWEGITVTIANIVFDVLEGDSDDLGLRIFVPGLASEHANDAHNALVRALDHALGEKELADSVQYLEVVPLPDDASAKDYIPLAELENYIKWRRKQERTTHEAQ
jgi:hypothetical protein